MMAINEPIHREGEVVHLVAQQLFDLSAPADRETEFKMPAGRGDELAQGADRTQAINQSRSFNRATCSFLMSILIP